MRHLLIARVALGVGVFFFVGLFELNNDSVPPDRITRDNAERIYLGMAQTKVEEVLGKSSARVEPEGFIAPKLVWIGKRGIIQVSIDSNGLADFPRPMLSSYSAGGIYFPGRTEVAEFFEIPAKGP
ncbi:MAG TPA: hypothetical protein VKE98_05160 [Gemmataceae bacterium]|nr:hypothetical protein [Gemmataceae bacterium]